MKRSTTAGLLSLVVPGAGLCFLGKWTWGLLNLVVATVVIVFASGAGLDWIHYLMLAIAAGSAGLAHAMASQPQRT